MDNFEKRLFLDYLSKLLNEIDVRCYSFGEVFDFFLEEFRVPKNNFDMDNCGELQLNNPKNRNDFKKKLKAVIKILQTKIQPRSTKLEKQLLLMKNIYRLDNDEYGLFIYFAIKEINNVFRELFDCISRDSITTFAKACLGLRYNRKSRVTESLYLKNLTDSRRGDVDINPDILQIFDDPDCNTANKMMRMLLGKTEVSYLTIADYKHIEPERKKVVNILKSAIKTKRKGVNILLWGHVGTGKTEFAKLIANNAKVPMYSVQCEQENLKEAGRESRLVDLYSKQNLLSKADNACLLFDEAEDVMNRGFSNFGNASKGYLNKILEETPVPVIWTTNNISDVDPAFLRRMTYAIEFEKLSEEVRFQIWNRVIKKNDFKVKKSKIEKLNKAYDIPPSIISNAVQTTKMIGGTEEDFEGFIENVARIVSKKKIVKQTKKKEFDKSEYDVRLVNADIDVEDLKNKIKNCGKLNFSICMYGEPGTGKSNYARYLAKELGLKVIQKRASDLISMWVGKTEENIAEAFLEAKEEKAMLIFDEADSFLQNRGSANHRWEISQVNEMLTWMEAAEYPFICTTNLLDTLDEASLRRFTFKIKFDFMNNQQTNLAMEHFFGVKRANLDIKGLTTGDFATVKKKVEFLKISDKAEIEKMLRDEVKLKQSKSLKNTVGF